MLGVFGKILQQICLQRSSNDSVCIFLLSLPYQVGLFVVDLFVFFIVIQHWADNDGQSLEERLPGASLTCWDNSTTSRSFSSKPVLLSKMVFSRHLRPIRPDEMGSRMSRAALLIWVDASKSRKCLQLCLRQESFYTIIIQTNPTGDYGSTTDVAVGSKVHQLCNENYEFVKVSIPGDQINLPWT